MANQIAEPDIAILLTGAARVVADRLGVAVRAAGVADMRASFGFVIRALAGHERTLTEVAVLLDVTKQAAIKVVDDMERRGLVERVPDPSDRRAKLLRLTDKAQQVRRAALAESRRMERELRRDVGPAEVDALRACLLALLTRHGAAETAAAGLSRAVW
jgi:DNA-binding MarR family transcriptional regulator